jgi:hypothetical protein
MIVLLDWLHVLGNATARAASRSQLLKYVGLLVRDEGAGTSPPAAGTYTFSVSTYVC